MLSRIAHGLYDLGRYVERAQNVARILEVNHKMNLERASVDEANVWTAISESFECGLDRPSEKDLYDELVLSSSRIHSVRYCIENARDEGRAMREHISEEMWLHLNQTHLRLAELSFGEILRLGRTEFNRQIEVFGDAFCGLADPHDDPRRVLGLPAHRKARGARDDDRPDPRGQAQVAGARARGGRGSARRPPVAGAAAFALGLRTLPAGLRRAHRFPSA